MTDRLIELFDIDDSGHCTDYREKAFLIVDRKAVPAVKKIIKELKPKVEKSIKEYCDNNYEGVEPRALERQLPDKLSDAGIKFTIFFEWVSVEVPFWDDEEDD